MWGKADAEALSRCNPPAHDASALAVSAGGRLLAVGDESGSWVTVDLWDPTARRARTPYVRRSSTLSHAARTPSLHHVRRRSLIGKRNPPLARPKAGLRRS